MVAIKSCAAFVVAMILLAPTTTHPAPTSAGGSLFAQSAALSLNRDFPSPAISYLLLDAQSGEVLASRWDDPETAIPLGSLMKPFAALAYGEQHGFNFPVYTCRGAATGCWRPSGHGRIELSSAIAYSCNSYFRALTADIDAAQIDRTSSRFHLENPDHDASRNSFAGLGAGWRVSPIHIARAYAELVREKDGYGVQQIISGMRASGLRGTGAEVDHIANHPALVKTGTAICSHAHHAAGDGFTVALVPADAPKLLLLVRVHGVPGAVAARTAGEMLRSLGE